MKLLERDVSIAELQAVLDAVGSKRGHIVLLGGEAGVGKTSLVNQFIAQVDRQIRVLVGACDPLSSPHPFGPFVDIAARLGPDMPNLLRDPANRPGVFAAMLDTLTAGPRTLVVIEDAHWADEASLDLLRYLGRRIAQTRALLLVTYRDDEVGSMHPLRTVLGHLATAPNVRRLSIDPLSEVAVASLASNTPLDPNDLFRQTGGNPFFVTEVIAAGTAGIPVSVRDAVLTRAARLSRSGRVLLEVAAVIGFRTEPWLLAEVGGPDAAACDECLDAGLLRVNDGLITFRHELARTTVLNAISPIRATALHAAVLASLSAHPAFAGNVARLAHHAEAAGNGKAVVAFAPQAARQAAEAGAHREAAAQYARTLRFMHEMSDAEREALLAAHLVECHAIGANAAAIESAQSLIDIAQVSGRREAEAKWAAWQASVHVTAGENDAAEAASRRSLALVADSPPSPEQLFAFGIQAHLRMLNRDLDDAVDWSERTLALAEALGDIAASIKALNTLGSARILTGDATCGEADLLLSLELAIANRFETDAALAYTNLGSSFGEMYQFATAGRYLEAGIDYVRARDLDRLGGYMVAWLALTRMYEGRWTDAAELANQVLRNPSAVAISRIMALLALGRVRARRGDPEVMVVLNEALDLSERTATLQRVGPVRAARAEAAWLAGHAEVASAEAGAAFDLASRHGHRWHIGELGFWLWRSGKLAGPPPLAAEPFAHHIAGNWAGAAAKWRELDCPYEAARAMAESSAEADLRAALATFEQLGARPDALAVGAKLRRLGFTHIPRGPRPTTRANAAGLTSRETDVLRLLVEGCSNPEIAARLFLSSKTVERHVSAILGKLGVQSRQEAAIVAQERSLLP